MVAPALPLDAEELDVDGPGLAQGELQALHGKLLDVVVVDRKVATKHDRNVGCIGRNEDLFERRRVVVLVQPIGEVTHEEQADGNIHKAGLGREHPVGLGT